MSTPEIDALFAASGHPLVHPSLVQPTQELIDAIAEPIARQFDLLPILLTNDGERRTLWIAMIDPTNAAAVSVCAAASGLPTRAMRAPADELRSSFHRWYGGPPPKPAAPPPRRPTSILELPAAEVEEIPSQRPPRARAVLVVQATAALAAACRRAFANEKVDVRAVDLLELSTFVRELSPFAIVLPEDVYHFDPAAFTSLAHHARSLLVTTLDGESTHLEPLLRSAFRCFAP